MMNKKKIPHPKPIVALTTQRALDNMREIAEIAKPLAALGMPYFTYGKMVNNVRCLNISNHAGYFSTYLEQMKKYPPAEFIEYAVAFKHFQHPKQIFSSQQIMKKLNKRGKTLTLQHECGLYHPLSIPIHDEKNHTVEIFSFYAPTAENSFVYEQLSQTENLAKFILYFKEKAEKILNTIALTPEEINLFCRKDNLLVGEQDKLIKKPVADIFPLKRYDLGAPFVKPLTAQEFSCLKLACQGMTAKQIAKQAGLSFRTIEKHLASLRRKANAKEFSEIRQALSHNYLFSLLGI